jgi:DNA polymerase III epsilon subunit-like protein
MYLFFDTETNGLPLQWNQPVTNVNNWPRIIQFAFILTDENFNILKGYKQLIKPDNWFIPVEKFWIDNGYSQEGNELAGIPLTDVIINEFLPALSQAKYMIAHNIAFDRPVVGAEFIRYGIKSPHKPIPICTMKSANSWVGARNSRGGGKWPQLQEMHRKCFGFDFDGAHDALADVRATMNCFKYLLKNNLIDEWKS